MQTDSIYDRDSHPFVDASARQSRGRKFSPQIFPLQERRRIDPME
jgi:hypothetical protein